MRQLNNLRLLAPRRASLPALICAALWVGVGRRALASTTGGLPWDSAILTLQDDLTGPVATAISVIAFLAAGAALVFGEELGGIAKKGLYVVLGVAFIVLGNKFLSVLGLTGALI